MHKTVCLIVGVFLFLHPLHAFAKHNASITITIKRAQETRSFSVPMEYPAGGASVAVSDLGTDGNAEIILGNGMGNEPRVRILRADGSEIGSFLAYLKNMRTGVEVIACDVDGDGVRDIITSPQRGGGPHIRIFSNFGEAKNTDGFMAYAETYRGGVHLACGNLDDDLREELVTLPAPGGGPHMRIWKMDNTGKEKMIKEFFDGASDDRRGRIGLVHNKKLYLATQQGKNIEVREKVIHSSSTNSTETNTITDAYGVLSIFVQDGAIKVTTTNGTSIDWANQNATAHGTDKFAIAASGDMNGDGMDELVLAPSAKILHRDLSPKSILVDLSDQQLYAYENGVLADTFAVSTARTPWTTPTGFTQVLAKIHTVRYSWSYSANNPNNYDLGLVPYNLRIFPHIYIHYAPWHHNFGHPMSHGCVNVGLENMKRLYAWATQDVPVEVRE